MIRAMGKLLDQNTFVIGLCDEDIEMLKGDTVASFSGEKYGFRGVNFVLMYGETNEDLLEILGSNKKMANPPKKKEEKKQ